MRLEKRHVETGRQHSLIAHQAEKRDRRGKLQKELLQRGQTKILVVLYLFIVVQKADDAENERKAKHVKVFEITCQHAGEAADDDGNQNARNEHQPAHRRRAGFSGVPRRTVLTNTLSGLECAQLGDQYPSRCRCDRKAQNAGNHDLHVF